MSVPNPPGGPPPDRWSQPPGTPPGGPAPGSWSQPGATPPGSWSQPGGTPPGSWSPPSGPPNFTGRFAGAGQRFFAAFLDAIITGLPLGILYAVIASKAPTHLERCGFNSERVCKVVDDGPRQLLLFLNIAVTVAVLYFYFARLVGQRGQTIGHKTMGIMVVAIESGQPMGVGRAFGRYLGRIVSAIPCALGFFWALWDQNKQTWHDKMVSSVVVRV